MPEQPKVCHFCGMSTKIEGSIRAFLARFASAPDQKEAAGPEWYKESSEMFKEYLEDVVKERVDLDDEKLQLLCPTHCNADTAVDVDVVDVDEEAEKENRKRPRSNSPPAASFHAAASPVKPKQDCVMAGNGRKRSCIIPSPPPSPKPKLCTPPDAPASALPKASEAPSAPVAPPCDKVCAQPSSGPLPGSTTVALEAAVAQILRRKTYLSLEDLLDEVKGSVPPVPPMEMDALVRLMGAWHDRNVVFYDEEHRVVYPL